MKNTNQMNYWIHTNSYGFKFFNQESDYFDFLEKNSFIFYNLNYGFGIDLITHVEKERYVKRQLDIVLSHQINIRSLNKKRKNGSRKHRKGYNYRYINTTQEKKKFFEVKYSEKEISMEYNVKIKGVRNAKVLPSVYDDLCSKAENNWKSRKQNKQWMRS